MIQKRDVNTTFMKNSLVFVFMKLFLLGYPVTCLKFYASKDDSKEDHQKMIAATCRC